MKTHDSRSRDTNGTIVLGLLIGGVMFAAAAYAGEPVLGLLMFAIMAVYCAVLYTGHRNDVIQVLRGDPVDERYQLMLHRAVMFAANALAVVVVIMFIYETATGGNPGPYSLMGFVFAVSMVASLIWQARTS